MKNQKGISLIKAIFIIILAVIAVSFIISKMIQSAEFNRKKESIEEINEAAVAYNVDVLKRNAIIKTYYPATPDDLLFKEVQIISLDTINSNNIDTMINLYKEEHFAVMDYNDTLLEYYREILQ